MTDTTTDFFDNVAGGAGAPTAVLKGIGDFVHGEVVEMFKRDYIPYGKDKPEINNDGSTRQQLVVILQTENRNWQNVVKVPKVDPADPKSAEKAPSEDDGKRAIYCPERSNIQFAIGRAVTASGARFEVGGTLGVKIVNLKDTGKGNPLKEHEAVYQGKPEGFFNQQPAAQAPAPQQEAPQAAPPAAEPAQPAPQAAPPAQPAPQQDPWATSQAPAPSAPPF